MNLHADGDGDLISNHIQLHALNHGMPLNMLSSTSVGFATLGMFIIDEFLFVDEHGVSTEKSLPTQIGGGGTYSVIGARLWLPAKQLGMVVDKGRDFTDSIQQTLIQYGPEMWVFRDQPNRPTNRALLTYTGQRLNFQYTTPKIRITPKDFINTKLDRARILHFISSPTRASNIISEVQDIEGWFPTTIFEPFPAYCVPEELPSLVKVLSSISILSPNAEEALCLLGLPLPPTKESIEKATDFFLDSGVGHAGKGCVIVRCGEMGAYIKSRELDGKWIDSFWTKAPDDVRRVVDVTGAGNSFLGGLAAGLLLSEGDLYQAVYYATVSASFTIEQAGLPKVSLDIDGSEIWNGDSPSRRLSIMMERNGHKNEHLIN